MKVRLTVFALLLLAAVYLLSGLYSVELSQVAVVKTFGKVTGQAGPGWHYRLPWPVQEAIKVEATTSLTMSVGYRVARALTGLPAVSEETEWLLGDLNIMNIEMVANYTIDDPARYVVFMDQEANPLAAGFLLRSIGESVLTEVLGGISYEHLLARRATIERDEIKVRIQKRLDAYESGIQLQSANLRTVDPPSNVAQAFQEFKSAETNSVRKRQEALSEANSIVQRARGEAYRIVAEASSEYSTLVQSARGRAESLARLATQYEDAPDETLQRLYWETVTAIRERAEVIVVDGGENAPAVRIFRRGR